MTSPRVLIVKTSSMGDVVHTLPAVSDILRARPDTHIDWLVEAPFAAIAQLHPGVRRTWPLAWRKWRRKLTAPATWAAMGDLSRSLKAEHYDLVLDLQGLLKSALWGRRAGAPLVGYDRASAREPLAALFYSASMPVPRGLQAVQRSRQLASMHLGYPLPGDPPRFDLRPPTEAIAGWLAPPRYSVLIPNASRPEKLWPEARWVSIGRRLAAAGLPPVVLWGTDAEQALAERIAADAQGHVPPFLKVGEMAGVLAAARIVVGLDTGFSHLGAALGVPTVGIYCDHDPGLAGITGPDAGLVASVGGKGQVPKLTEVSALIERVLEAPR